MESSSSPGFERAPGRRRRAFAAFALAACAGAASPALGAPVEGTKETGAAVTPRLDPPGEARALSRAFAAVARALGPSVVRIDVELDRGGKRALPDLPFLHGPDEAPDLGPAAGVGSGVILSAAGDVVTNRHVVEGASKVTVTLHDGRELAAKVLGRDERTDVAVLRLSSPPPDLVAARLGDSDHLEVGEWVLAIGSPLGLEQTVTAGIVSGKGRVGRRVQMSGDRVRSYIETDAKINPGNSGGPLVNLDGEVIGVNTLINAGPGGSYGFAIPINQVRRVAQALLADGRVRYPYLGVTVGDVRDLDAGKRSGLPKDVPERSAIVSEVSPGGPAAKAGILTGDVIVAIDGARISGASDVVDYVSSRSIGARVIVHLIRDGRAAAVPATLAELPSADLPERASAAEAPHLGLSLQTLTREMARSLGLPAGTQGAVITEVAAGSPAERSRLGPGEVVIEVNRRPVASAEEATRALRAAAPGSILLRVRGAKSARFVTIER